MSATPGKIRYVGFVNAVVPRSDYRLGFARDSLVADVVLALPGRPESLDEDRFVPIDVGEGFSWRAVRELLRIPRILRRTDADIAHFFATQFVLIGPPLARLAGVRSVVTVTGMGRTFESSDGRMRWRGGVYRWLFRISATCSDWVLFQNQGDLLALTTAAGARNAHKLRLIGSAVDEAVFEAATPEPVASRPVCLMVARVQQAKGVDDFLHAARLLRAQADFVLVGPPTAGQEELVEAVESAAREGLIRYVGPATDAEVRDWYRRVNLVLLPSRTEGLPRVALEAGVSGRAVLAYAIPGCVAALPPSALVEVGDRDAMMGRLEEICGDPDVRSALAREVRQWVRTRFGLGGYVERLDALVAAAVGRKVGNTYSEDSDVADK